MKKKKLLLILPAVILIVAGVVLFLYFGKGKKGNNNSQGFGKERFSGSSFSGSVITADMVTASGVTNMGTVSETFDVTELSTELRIEAVYVSSGDSLKAGDRVLKLTQESVAAARAELEDKVLDAELAYRAGAIEYERSKIVAEYDRDSTKLSGSQAEAVYQDSLADVNSDVESAQSKLDQTKEQIAEYAAYVDGNNYSEYFEVDKYQKLYDENLKLLTDHMEKWGITWPQVTGGDMPMRDNTSEYNQWVSVLKSLYSVLEQNAKDLNSAKEAYEEAISSASLEKKLLELSLPELEEKLSQAKASSEKALLENELTKEKSISDAEKADHDYETAIEKAESDFNDLKSAWEDAKKNLEIFEEQVGDGFFYASADGNVLRMSVRAQNTLRADSTILTYSDTSAMTVTVSVDQSNIAKITPGETAVVMSQSGVTKDGIVKSVNPISTSEGRNNVTYSVTVELDGAGRLGSNESVTVIFGTTAQELMGTSTQPAESGSEGSGEGRPERPEGMQGMPGNWSGEMPEGIPEGMPGNWSGEMPEGMPEGFPGNWSGERPEGMPGGRPGKRDGEDAGE
ncbi:MAG: HlyD family efflux transporter periplasmic adaptor subunit [Lachnospiraceae bacterium]|nr:HlyD family efflux transporter periplasmic adaptor subunit [Lachnospiraceae bacterium]